MATGRKGRGVGRRDGRKVRGMRGGVRGRRERMEEEGKRDK